MAKHIGLGKGLDALIPGGFQPISTSSNEPGSDLSGFINIPIEKIIPNPRQPRSFFNEEHLAELAASIKEHGIIQPLLVSRNPNDDLYTLIAGERRWQACKIANLTVVPAIVRQTTDQQKLELALIENIQRQDLNALEEANAYRHLSEDFNLSHEVIAARVGKSRVTITNTLRLLNLPEAVQNSLLSGDITEGHARALLGLSNPKAIESALLTVITKKLTVRQTEELVNLLKGIQLAKKPAATPSADTLAIEEYLRININQKVNLKIGDNKPSGSMTIYFGSEEEFQSLMIRLTGKEYSP
jgi:ParB family chromosome partitioning protein